MLFFSHLQDPRFLCRSLDDDLTPYGSLDPTPYDSLDPTPFDSLATLYGSLDPTPFDSLATLYGSLNPTPEPTRLPTPEPTSSSYRVGFTGRNGTVVQLCVVYAVLPTCSR